MNSILKIATLGLVLVGCAKPVANDLAPKTSRSATHDDVSMAVFLKNTYEVSDKNSGNKFQLNLVAPISSPPDQVVNCPTSGTIESSFILDEETFEFVALTHANMCMDGEEFVDGDVLFSYGQGFEFQNLSSRSNSFCEYITSNLNGTVTPTSGTGAQSNLTVTYSEGPSALLNHTFTLTSQTTYANVSPGTPPITGSGTIVREDGLTTTYQMEAGTFVNSAECEGPRGYLQFTTSESMIIRFEDSCGNESPKLLINGVVIDEESSCT